MNETHSVSTTTNVFILESIAVNYVKRCVLCSEFAKSPESGRVMNILQSEERMRAAMNQLSYEELSGELTREKIDRELLESEEGLEPHFLEFVRRKLTANRNETRTSRKEGTSREDNGTPVGSLQGPSRSTHATASSSSKSTTFRGERGSLQSGSTNKYQKWTPNQVADGIGRLLKTDRFRQTILANQIGGHMLTTLTDEDWAALGVDKQAQRSILNAVKKMLI
jgi:hypothetical protein